MIDERIVEIKLCRHCNSEFEITDKDLEFYKKISPVFTSPQPSTSSGMTMGLPFKVEGEKKVKYLIPPPKLCPECRKKRRLSFLNYSKLYKNVCLSCNKQIVSRFSKECKIKNYCNECWSKNDWNQLEQGIDIDFNKSFFSQISYLIENTIFQNLIGSSSNILNNSVYTNHTSEIHNSYFVSEANGVNDSLYCYTLKNSSFIVDSAFIGHSEYVYESIDCYNMYKVYYSKNSYGCRFSYFLDSCQNCSYCIGCVNLVNKDYYIFNKKVSKQDYEKLKESLSNYDFLINFKKEFLDFNNKQIKKSNNLIGSENSTGNNIINSKNCKNSFDILECSDCKYCDSVNYSSDLFDVSSYGENSNRMYESVSVGRQSNNILFSSVVGKSENLIYCIDVKRSKNCFGCVNLENKEYCILNKQYTKEEYEELVPKIIEHMKKTGEWGEFFPSFISPFGYNETLVGEYYPINTPSVPSISGEGSKKFQFNYFSGNGKLTEELRGIGVFNRSNYKTSFPKVEKIIPANKLPKKIENIPDDILNWAIECEESKELFKITKKELEFYRKHNLPISRKHSYYRHLDRIKSRNPRKIYDRKCDKCGIDIKTTYSPGRKETVYCQTCYEKEVY